MKKYRVTVKVVAEVEYTVEVEAMWEHEADDKATGMWRQQLPDDFQVDKGYISNWSVEDTQQLTHYCTRCERSYPANVENAAPCTTFSPRPLQPWKEDDEYCEMCGPVVEAEEKAEDEARAAQAW